MLSNMLLYSLCIINANQELNPLRGNLYINLFICELHPRLLIDLPAIWQIKCLKDINFNNPVRSSGNSIKHLKQPRRGLNL